MLSFFACLIGMFSPVSVTYADIVNVQDRHIRLSDVVDLKNLDSDIKGKVSRKIIASIPADKSYVTLTRQSIANLIRRRIPGMPLDNEGETSQLVRIEYSKNKTLPDSRKCSDFNKSVPRGKAIIAEDLITVSCDTTRALAAMKYDPSTNVLRASDDISLGSYAGPISVTSGRFADKDDELLLRVVLGPVKIEKTVWAMQPANGADHIFVQDREGHILRVPIQSPISQKGKK